VYGTTNVTTLPDGTVTLDDLVARVGAGEEIMIARDGRPVARLVPGPYVPHPSKPIRRPGLYAGTGSIGPEFFEPLPEEELRLWEGGDDE